MINKIFSTSTTIASTIALTCLSAMAGLAEVTAANQSATLAQQPLAQQVSPAPQIDSFEVNPVNQLAPGTELVFTLQGTPGAQASLTIGNLVRNLPMREVEPGYYEGRYTVRSRDQITNNAIVRANLRQGDRISSVRLQQPLIATTSGTPSSSTNQNSTNQNSTNQNPTNPNSTNQTALRIDRFTLQPVTQLDPGTELNFTLVGTPNARATLTIEGVAYNLPMQEVSSGTYQGQYVVRRQDAFSSTGTIATASLQLDNQVVRARLEQTLTATSTATQLPLEITTPTNNAQVRGTVEVRGKSAPNATVNVRVRATTSLAGLVGVDRDIFNRTIATDAQGNFSFSFRPTITVPGTRYEVSLNATRGNQTNAETLVLFQQ